MKISGLTRDIINFILKKVETYLPDYRADSFEDYEKKYIEGITSLVEKSVPFLKLKKNLKLF